MCAHIPFAVITSYNHVSACAYEYYPVLSTILLYASGPVHYECVHINPTANEAFYYDVQMLPKRDEWSADLQRSIVLLLLSLELAG